MPPSSGTVQYRNEDLEVEPESVYQRVAIATPYMDLIDEFTLAEHLRFHFSLRDPRHGLSVKQLLQEMELNDARNKYIGNFSSGMKQRVKLAFALYTEADVVFLDEPGTNLDGKAFDWYLRSLKQIPDRCLIFIASNQAREHPQNAVKVDIMTFK